MEERLKAIFSNVNDWLKFAEAKNGALIAFNASTVGLIFSRILTNNDLPAIFNSIWVKGYFYIYVLCAGLGFIISLLSFLAKIKITYFYTNGMTDPKDNLLFFGDICKYKNKTRTYLDRLRSNVGAGRTESYTKIEEDYAEQIIENSCIAMRKYRHFNTALWFTIAGIVTPPLALLLWAVNRLE